MPYESPVPPVPNRHDEHRFIERMERDFLAQPWYKMYMNEALRTRKIEDSEKMNSIKRNWLYNFTIGSVISAFIALPIGKYYDRAQSGVPQFYRPKMYFHQWQQHNGYRNTVRRIAVISTWFALSCAYAYTFTNYEKLDDEYFEKVKVKKMF
mmetsp:Transcript_29878/g.27360  ORF Transcript_29878/g.27360 Transcript_29878/m.27360 type:complete len:152 (+) Transcript_29878:66-521(+)